MRGVGHDFFKKSRFYNVSQLGEELSVERGLSLIEQKYARVLRKIKKFDVLSDGDRQDLSRFVIATMVRVESFQENMNDTIGSLVQIHRDLGGDTDFHRRYFYGSEDLPKRLIVENSSLDFLAWNGLSIIVNRSHLPFVTCDNPVLRREMHSDEIAMFVGHGAHCRAGFSPGQAKPFFYMPVSAEMAIVSCELIDHAVVGNQYIQCADAHVILRLNFLLIAQAEKYIVADRVLPVGSSESRFLESLRDGELDSGIRARIYTTQGRYVFDVLSISEIPDGVSLRLLDADVYRGLVSDGDVVSLEVYEGGRNTRGMRQIEIDGVDDESLEIRIVSKFKLGLL